VSNIPLRWGGMHLDTGGINFDTSLDIERSLVMFAVIQLENKIWQRQNILVPVGLSSWMWVNYKYLKCTIHDNSDGLWKEIYVEIPDECFGELIVVETGIINNEEFAKIYDAEGNLIGENSRDDIISSVEGTITRVNVGGAPGWNPLYGTIYSCAIFNKGNLDIPDVIKEFYNDKVYINNYATFACIFDRLKYGDIPYDFINGVYSVPADPNRPPRWKLRLIKDMEG